MAKKVKSFNVDEETYDSLVSFFRKYKSSVSLSSFIEQRIGDLLRYLRGMEATLKGAEEFEEVMRYVIEQTVRESFVRMPSSIYLEEVNVHLVRGEPTIVGLTYVEEEPERKGEAVGCTIEMGQEIDTEKEAEYWKDEYEAMKKGISRAFVRFLRTGNYTLARDKRFLMEKETGERYVNFPPSHIIRVAKDVETK